MPDTAALTDTPRVFVSYSRADEPTAIEILRWIEGHNIPCWRDRNDMRSGRDWWQQIVDALRVVDYMVLLATPTSMASPIVEREWRQARQEGVCVLPIMLPDNAPDFAAMPKWMRDVDFFDYHKGDRAHFIAQLQAKCEIPRVPFMAPALPENFVQRPQQFVELKRLLIDTARGEPIAVTTALQGGGGFGKTTLAAALCHDRDVQEVFDDGVLWVTLGEEPDILGALGSLWGMLTGQRSTFTTVEAAKAALNEALDRRDCLLVIDDAWKSPHVKAFLIGNQTAHLITTRQLDVVVAAGATSGKVDVDEMGDDEALQLLTARLNPTPTDVDGCRGLCQRLGEWPLLLEIANGWLRKQVARGRTPDEALIALNERLDRKGMARVLVRKDETARKRSAADTVSISLDALDDAELVAAAYPLGIFAEDSDIPLSSIAALWGMDDIDTEDRLEALHDASLLRYDPDAATVRLHDVVRQVLCDGVADVPAMHRQLVANWGDLKALPDAYAWTNLAHHMQAAGMEDDLAALLLDFEWLQAKLNATDVNALLEDFSALQYPISGYRVTALMDVERALLKSAHVLDDTTQLAGQLLGRLSEASSVSEARSTIEQLLRQCRAINGLIPLVTSLTPAHDPLMRTIQTDSRVNALAEMPDGRIITAEHNDTITVWDQYTWTRLHKLDGHRKTINALAVLDDAHVVSASDDHSLRIWNVRTGEEVRRLYGHDSRVLSVVVAHGRIVSGGGDNSVRVWSGELGPEVLPAEKGGELHVLRGHKDDVNDLAVAPDGTVWSASLDGSLRQWDVVDGKVLQTVETPNLRPAGLDFAEDGTLFYYGRHTEKDVSQVYRLDGHNGTPEIFGNQQGWLMDIAAMGSTVAYTGSTDRLLYRWAVTSLLSSTPPSRHYTGHMGTVNAVLVRHNKQVLSGSSDATFRLWETRDRINLEGLRYTFLPQHGERIYNITMLDDETLITLTNDGSVGLWNASDYTLTEHTEPLDSRKAYIAPLDAHQALVVTGQDLYRYDRAANSLQPVAQLPAKKANATCQPIVLPDGRVITGSSHHQWHVWDSATWELLATHKAHGGGVGYITRYGEDEILLGSTNNAISRHDLERGKSLRVYDGHRGRVNGLVVLPDGRFVSCSADRHLCVWERDNSQPLQRIYAHDGFINELAWLRGSLVVSVGFDNRVRVWDINAGALLATYTADGALNCVTVRESDGLIMAGDSMGRVHWLRLRR
jgi:WD40 repeat protein